MPFCASLCWHTVIFYVLQEPQIYCTDDTAMQGHGRIYRICWDKTMCGVQNPAIQKLSNQERFSDATKQVPRKELTEHPVLSSAVRITSTALTDQMAMMQFAPCSL